MRKIVCVLLAICCCMCLVSCGAEKAPKAPDDKLIQADLEEEVTYYKDFLSLKEFEIQQSLTEETEYTATISAVAESAYAEFELTADVVYTKYDQGWGLDSCDWQELGHTLEHYPDTEEVSEWIQSGNGLSDAAWCSQQVIELSENGETVRSVGTYESWLGSCILITHKSASSWAYNSVTDNWDYRGSDESADISLHNLEGKYASSSYEGDIIISDVSDDGFNIQDTALSTNSIRVSYDKISDDGQFIYYKGTGLNYSAQKINGSEGTDVAGMVCFMGNEDSVTIMFTVNADNLSHSITDITTIK